MATQCSKVSRMVLPSLLVFRFRGMPSGFATMTEGARIRYVKPGRKAGTDRRSTVGTTVTERIPEGRIGPKRLCASSARRNVRGSPREVKERKERHPSTTKFAETNNDRSMRFIQRWSSTPPSTSYWILVRRLARDQPARTPTPLRRFRFALLT